MLVYEYKLDGDAKQYQAIDEAIRTVQFVRNKCLRLWMDGERVNKNDVQTYCAVLAKAYLSLLDSIHRQGKPVQTEHGLLLPGSMTTARNTNRGKKAIRNSSTITVLSTTSRLVGNLSRMASISLSRMGAGSGVCAWLGIRNRRSKHFLSSKSNAFALSSVLMATMSNSA